MDDESKAVYFDKIQSNIAEYGYHLTHVSGNRRDEEFEPSFCYSTGISETYGIPEIFISSLPAGLCSSLIKAYIERFTLTKAIVSYEKLQLLDDWFAVYLCEVENSHLTEYALSTFKFYPSNEFSYLQLVFPDTNGLFPNETGYDYDQVLLTDFFNQ